MALDFLIQLLVNGFIIGLALWCSSNGICFDIQI